MSRLLAVGAATTLLLTAGCMSEAADEGPTTVFAAASLSKSFEELAQDRDLEVDFSFDGSSGLVDQISGGAPADVFASADTANMDRAVAEELIDGDPVRFATNVLVLVTPPGNPGDITGFDDSLDGSRLVTCAPEVPCGRATQGLAETVGLALEPVSEESKVTDVLGKVTSGEADAGLVYTTDATSAGEDVNIIEIPESAQHLNEYWIAAVAGGDTDRAKTFIDLVTGDEGQALLADYGFGPA